MEFLYFFFFIETRRLGPNYIKLYKLNIRCCFNNLQLLRGNIGQSAALLFNKLLDQPFKCIKERKVPTLVVTGTTNKFVNAAHSHLFKER